MVVVFISTLQSIIYDSKEYVQFKYQSVDIFLPDKNLCHNYIKL